MPGGKAKNHAAEFSVGEEKEERKGANSLPLIEKEKKIGKRPGRRPTPRHAQQKGKRRKGRNQAVCILHVYLAHKRKKKAGGEDGQADPPRPDGKKERKKNEAPALGSLQVWQAHLQEKGKNKKVGLGGVGVPGLPFYASFTGGEKREEREKREIQYFPALHRKVQERGRDNPRG